LISERPWEEALGELRSRIKCLHVETGDREAYCILKIEKYVLEDSIYVKKGSLEMEICLECLCVLA